MTSQDQWVSINKACAICGRHAKVMTKHHLVPRSRLRHRRRDERKKLKNQQIPNLVWICRPCHSHLHRVFTEKQLDREYNTLEKIQEHPDIITFANWIKNKPLDFRPKH